MTSRHLVRPRWIWGGLAAGIAGGCVLGVGIYLLDLVVVVVGLVVLALGSAAALFGGVLYDAHKSQTIGEELEQVKEADVHPGIVPGDRLGGVPALREARQAATDADVALTTRRTAPRPPLALGGSIMLLVAAAFVLCAQVLYSHTPSGQNEAVRDLGIAVLVGLAGLRVLVSPGAHPIAACLAIAAGIGYLLLGFLSDHGATRIAAIEIAVGIWVIVGGLLCLSSPAPPGRVDA